MKQGSTATAPGGRSGSLVLRWLGSRPASAGGKRQRWRRLVLGFAGLATCALLALLLAASRVPELEIAPADLSVEVLDREGQPLRLYTNSQDNWALPVDSSRVDPRFLRELLAYEDKRFWEHHGVDPLATLRAALQWLWHGEVISGASTLTMQTIRLLQPKPRTLRNKFIEMVQALRLERRMSKRRILDLYLTLAPYGGNLQGLRAASRFYFDKEPDHLMPSERALLIALPQSPAARRPDRYPERAARARRHVLKRMLSYGLIEAEDLDLASSQPIPGVRRTASLLAPHLADRLRLADPSQRQIRTTIHGSFQRQLEQLAAALQRQLEPGVTLAILVIDHTRFEVVAYLGSGGFLEGGGQLDLITAVRSPGSTLKPFIYGLGFEAGQMHPETRVLDRPRWIGDYGPRNFDSRYRGEVSIREALWKSLNTPAVQALQRIGPGRFHSRLAEVGVTLRLPPESAPGLPMALGGVGITLEELTRLYAAQASEGEMGRLRLRDEDPPGSLGRLLDPTASWYLDDILREAEPPAGFPPGRGIRFKTGTSYGYRDAWALGYAGNYTVGVWTGRPDGGYHGEVTGLEGAAPLLFRVFELLPTQPRPRPRAAGVQQLTHAQLPPALQWLGERPDDDGGRRPRIRFPLDGSLTVLDARQSDRALPLMVEGGRPPYSWLVDGEPLISGLYRSQTPWQPRGIGEARITVLDAGGAADSISVWVENGDP